MRSLAPREEIRDKVLEKFRQPTLLRVNWVKVWSAAQRRFVWIKQENRVPLTFIPGIYSLKLDSAWNIIAVTRETMVVFSPSRYQSQLFFKNSCLAEPVRQREL